MAAIPDELDLDTESTANTCVFPGLASKLIACRAQSLGQAAQAVALAISQLLGTISSARAEQAAVRAPSPPKDALDESVDVIDTEIQDSLTSNDETITLPRDAPTR
jgi:hypothetical protein